MSFGVRQLYFQYFLIISLFISSKKLFVSLFLHWKMRYFSFFDVATIFFKSNIFSINKSFNVNMRQEKLLRNCVFLIKKSSLNWELWHHANFYLSESLIAFLKYFVFNSSYLRLFLFSLMAVLKCPLTEAKHTYALLQLIF